MNHGVRGTLTTPASNLAVWGPVLHGGLGLFRGLALCFSLGMSGRHCGCGYDRVLGVWICQSL